ncbi:hypothetical protein [Bacillus sp. V3-13]|uniref:hypothetical protein n=1 Tax=Bacillus sp. V3-13 TaxID=2053728 RepID=UPI001158B064|nr:hypothetical protein [Bacillus sp. V3-13]
MDMRKKLENIIKERELEQQRYKELMKKFQSNSEKLEAKEKKYDELKEKFENKIEAKEKKYDELKSAYEKQKQEYEQLKATYEQQKKGLHRQERVNSEENNTSPSETQGQSMDQEALPKKHMRTPLDVVRMAKPNPIQTIAPKQVTFRDIQRNLQQIKCK